MKYCFFSILLFPSLFFSQQKWDLKKCVDYALTHNISIKQAKINSKNQQQEVRKNKGAFLPNLSSSSSQSFSFKKGFENPTLGTVNSGTSSQFSLGLSSNWTIFNGFQNLNVYKKSLIDQKYADTNIEVLKNNTSLNVVNAYLQLLFAEEQEKVSKSSLELNQLQYKQAKLRYEEGADAKATIYESDANVARAEQSLIKAENDIRSSKLNLTQLLQLPFDPSFDIKTIALKKLKTKLSLKSPQDIYNEALRIRPEIQYASLAVESADKAIKISKGAYLPTLSLRYNFGTNYYNIYMRNDDDFLKQLKRNWNHTFGLSLNIPIFNQRITKTSVEKQILAKENSELDLENEKLKLRKNIETAYIDASNAEKTYQASNKSVASTKIALEYAQKRFQIGAANNYDFEQAKNNYISAQIDLIKAKYDYIFKVKVLEFYAGVPLVTIN